MKVQNLELVLLSKGASATMGVIGEICPFRQKIIFQISTVLTILGDSQDLKPYVSKKICTFSSL